MIKVEISETASMLAVSEFFLELLKKHLKGHSYDEQVKVQSGTSSHMLSPSDDTVMFESSRVSFVRVHDLVDDIGGFFVVSLNNFDECADYPGDEGDTVEIFNILLPLYFRMLKVGGLDALREMTSLAGLPDILTLTLLSYTQTRDFISIKLTDREKFESVVTSISVFGG